MATILETLHQSVKDSTQSITYGGTKYFVIPLTPDESEKTMELAKSLAALKPGDPTEIQTWDIEGYSEKDVDRMAQNLGVLKTVGGRKAIYRFYVDFASLRAMICLRDVDMNPVFPEDKIGESVKILQRESKQKGADSLLGLISEALEKYEQKEEEEGN